MKVKTVLSLLAVLGLILAIRWTIKSNFEYEPIITAISLVSSIIGLNLDSTKLNRNISFSLGKNETEQSIKSNSAENTNNSVSIGINKTKQTIE